MGLRVGRAVVGCRVIGRVSASPHLVAAEQPYCLQAKSSCRVHCLPYGIGATRASVHSSRRGEPTLCFNPCCCASRTHYVGPRIRDAEMQYSRPGEQSELNIKSRWRSWSSFVRSWFGFRSRITLHYFMKNLQVCVYVYDVTFLSISGSDFDEAALRHSLVGKILGKSDDGAISQLTKTVLWVPWMVRMAPSASLLACALQRNADCFRCRQLSPTRRRHPARRSSRGPNHLTPQCCDSGTLIKRHRRLRFHASGESTTSDDRWRGRSSQNSHGKWLPPASPP